MNGAIAKQADRFSETEIGGEVIVMHLETGDFFSLTDSGADIWRLLDGKRSREDVIAALAEDYAASEDEISADVDAFVAKLGEAGFLATG